MVNYSINEDLRVLTKERGWCGYRAVLIMGVAVSVIVYTIGAIITGVTYRDWDRRANCTVVYPDGSIHYEPDDLYLYNTPLVVVGPCFMAVGGAIVTFMILQWFLCRPTYWR
ncbi:uncharacterized protein LOC122253417 [Penaeus japonicus]|uniref:uncharacterized protein LOC122253417 n=1 Tax=Penaeus japonicus TaxID=27405 RepID=UPI001C70E34B|nr:uncharacterized protein LOC122253417 [Penaeus japonicus]